jgi:hypothetical protein
MYRNSRLGSRPNTDGMVELKALPSKSMNCNVLMPSKLASVNPPVKKEKDISKFFKLSGRRGITPEKAVSSARIVAAVVVVVVVDINNGVAPPCKT